MILGPSGSCHRTAAGARWCAILGAWILERHLANVVAPSHACIASRAGRSPLGALNLWRRPGVDLRHDKYLLLDILPDGWQVVEGRQLHSSGSEHGGRG